MDKKDSEKNAEVFPGYTSVQDFTKDGFKVLVEATRNANGLPQERTWDYYNTRESFRNIMNTEGNNILRLINNIIRDQGVLGSFSSRDLEEKIEVIVEANDAILERVAINLDEVNGIRKNPEMALDIQEVSAVLPVSGSWNKIDNINCTVSSFEPKNQNMKTAPNAIRLITGINIQRPQKFFEDIIDNSNKFLWQPRIKDKPNSLKPLAIFLEENEDGTESFSHPYDFELDHFTPSEDLLKPVEPAKPKSLSETPLCMVETAEELDKMLEDLRKYNVLGVDLEHHSYRSFMGITCLMQISTGETDYLVDTLCLRDKLCILNEVFTKPTIVKIFHGADHDIEWLQRDLSLYIVNMFDTYQAAKSLGYDQRSLAYLMKRFCRVDANKHFQLADWRIRPLPDELKLYAREDTHYLIYIYHRMRNELIELGNKKPHILKSVIDRSTELCKKRYRKPVLTENSHMDLFRRCKKMFDNKQMYALKELYKWRDTVARTEDESLGYVLPNHMLMQIAEILPREMQGVLACCNPIPPLVRGNLLEIHKIILKARDQSLVKPILSEESRSMGSVQTATRLNVENALHCPHDTSETPEFRDDLPTLLGPILKQKKSSENKSEPPIGSKIQNVKIENKGPILDVFEKIEHFLKKINQDAVRKVKKLKFLGPYERYKLVKPYIQAEEEKKEALLEKETIQAKTVPEELGDILNIENINDDLKEGKVERVVMEEVNGDMKIDTNVSRSNNHENSPEQKNKKRKSEVIPLRQMQGCKRKRSPSHNRESTKEIDPEEVPSVEEIVAPLSDVRPGPEHTDWYNDKNNRKRKNNKNPRDGKRQKFEQSNRNNISNQNQQNIQQPQKQNKNKSPNKNWNNAQQSNRGQNSWNGQQSNKNKFHGKNKFDRGNFQAFDYSSVDFKQFQGGAGSVNNSGNLRTNFKAKNKSKVRGRGIGKGNNKSSFFGMNNNAGRGRR